MSTLHILLVALIAGAVTVSGQTGSLIDCYVPSVIYASITQ